MRAALLVGLILRSRAKRSVSKDEAGTSASWFETRGSAALLTMREKALLPAVVAFHRATGALEGARMRHGDDVVTGIDEMNFAGNTGRQIRQ